jgi:hypothetical protein
MLVLKVTHLKKLKNSYSVLSILSFDISSFYNPVVNFGKKPPLYSLLGTTERLRS